ncbi:MAG: hypothetical protein KDK99_22570 [Verrucomicrobiales bacterium]|nr:hypothetical protein [Verrucomicrobiales bacterium]
MFFRYLSVIVLACLLNSRCNGWDFQLLEMVSSPTASISIVAGKVEKSKFGDIVCVPSRIYLLQSKRDLLEVVKMGHPESSEVGGDFVAVVINDPRMYSWLNPAIPDDIDGNFMGGSDGFAFVFIPANSKGQFNSVLTPRKPLSSHEFCTELLGLREKKQNGELSGAKEDAQK